MKIRVAFRDLTETWETELTSPEPLSCRNAARSALEQTGASLSRDLNGVVYMAGGKRLDPEAMLADGDSVTVVVLVGGG